MSQALGSIAFILAVVSGRRLHPRVPGVRGRHVAVGAACGEGARGPLFPSLPQVRATVASWRADYNLNRPHSRLGWLTPAEHADTKRQAIPLIPVL